MPKFCLIIVIAALLGGCATNPIPPGYTGPLSRIEDTEQSRSGTSAADFFFVAAIDGHKIADSLAQTTAANTGQGFRMTPVTVGRDVPAQPASFTITGRTHYPAPILELTNPVFQISGNVTFTPTPNRIYEVKGILGNDYSAVWIEDKETGAIAGNKIETNGKSALGFFEK